MAGINLEGRAVLVEDATPKPVASFGDMMQEMARVSAEEAAQARQEAGITRSLTDTDKAVQAAMMQEPVSTLEPALPLENAIPEPSPVGVEELEPAPLASVEGQIIETPQQPTQGGAAIGQDQPITQPSAEQTTILPDQPAGLVAPTLGEQPIVDALSNEMLDVPVQEQQPAEQTPVETTTNGDLSGRLDTKGQEVTKYDTMLFSEDTKEKNTGIQGKLTNLGYVPRGIDGSLGKGSKAAIRSFQEANGLPVTGEADSATIDKLKSPDAKRYKFSDAVESAYTEFADTEETKAHLGGADYKDVGITLAYGVLPDEGLKYKHDGKIISIPKERSKRWPTLSAAGVTTKNFNPDNVIADDAIKNGVKRGDYSSDEEWGKASITAFEDDIKTTMIEEGVDPSKVNKDVMKGFIGFTWNTGGFAYTGMKNAYKEVVKDEPNIQTIKNGMFQVFTAGGIVIRGLASRRAIDYNSVATGLGKSKITHYTPLKLSNGNAGVRYTYDDNTTEVVDTLKDYETKASKSSFKDFKDQKIPLGG